MKKDSLHVAFCGLSGFPFATSAAVNKMAAMAKGLVEAGSDISIVNRKGVIEPKLGIEDQPEGVYQGLPYYTASGSLLRPQGFGKRNWLKLTGVFREIGLMRRLKRDKQLDVVVLDTPYLSVILLYRILGKLLGYKLVYHYVEMRSEINKDKKGAIKRLSHQMMDERVTKLFDGIMPISSVLQDWVKEKDPRKPMFRIPVLADYHQFAVAKRPEREPYYLYCGSSAYAEVIYFIIEAFEQLPNSNETKLYMVIRGPKDKQDQVLARIASSPKAAKIQVFSDLPYEELAHKYVDAIGLLIPLRPTVQDAARFPYKVGEYLATGNPVVTTNYGELRGYFEDMKNGLVADSYDLSLYVEKLQFIVEHPKQAAAIGKAGYEMGVENFHYERIGVNMRNFLAGLVGNKDVALAKEVSVS